jgi:hypothetical protein
MQRVDALERRPAAGPTARYLPALADDSAPTLIESAPTAPRAAAPAAAPVSPGIGLASVVAPSAPQPVQWSVAPMGPVLDVKQIERSMGDIDVPFNGRRRQRLIVVTVIFFLLLAVAGALAALAYNNSSPNVVPSTPAAT